MSYRKNNVINVSKATVHECLERAEGILGFQPQKCDPEIIYANPKIAEHFDVSGIYFAGKFILPEEVEESTVLHEGVHYLMSKSGLFLPVDPSSANIFYDKLVNETIAESATGEVYGYPSGVIENMTSISEQEIDTRVDKIASERGMTTDEKAAYRAYYSNAMIYAVTMINQQLFIERGYLEAEDTIPLIPLIKYLYEYFDRQRDDSINFAVKALAVRNAAGLRDHNVSSKDMVGWIGDAVKNGWDSFDIYFWDVVRGAAGR
ncbi:MAG TPA: hypothetical protein VJB05_02610 [archaeon]|nr:hypothetical protein [archaeon]